MADFRVHHVRFFDYTPSAVHCLAYEKSLQRLAVARSDGTIEIWNLKENWFQEKVLPPPEDSSVDALLWCRQRLFSAGLHGNLHEHDLQTGNIMRTVSSNNGPIWCMTLNDKETQIAAGTESGCIVLFDVTEDDVLYARALDKQEGRILSLAWHCPEGLLVTGGIDNLRVWSVNSGHALQRLSLGRQERSKETIVWAVAITKDFTIVSGDSRGKTCFWNGRQGTLLKSFQSHKADVLSLCVSDAGDSVVASGVDPLITRFEHVSAGATSDLRTWVRASFWALHTHDVRAVIFAGDDVISGGVDCQLVRSSPHPKSKVITKKTLPAIPQAAISYTAKDAHMVLLRNHSSLELWKLGSTSAKSAANGEFLALDSQPLKLLELRSKSSRYITCAAVSSDARWIAYSDHDKLRLFKTNIEDGPSLLYPSISLNRVHFLPPGVHTPYLLAFSPDGSMLLSATSSGDVQVIRPDRVQPELLATLTPPKRDLPVTVNVIAISDSQKYIGVGDLGGDVHIYDFKKHKHLVTLPKYPHPPVCLTFHPTLPLVAVAHTDQTIVEYDVAATEYTDWTRDHLGHFPDSWTRSLHKIRQITYNPRNPRQIIVRSIKSFCIIDKTQPFPSKDADLTKKINKSSHHQQHAFHLCSKFKYLLHLDLLEDDFLLAVERTSLALMNKLPPTLRQNKFGT